MKRNLWTVVPGLLLLVAPVVVAFPAGAAERFCQQISLPHGWQPEGIVTGQGPVLYAGSLVGLGIHRVDLRTDEGQLLADGEGRTNLLDGETLTRWREAPELALVRAAYRRRIPFATAS